MIDVYKRQALYYGIRECFVVVGEFRVLIALGRIGTKMIYFEEQVAFE